MSKISEQLIKYAQEEKVAHQTYVKDFSSSAIAHLTQGGLDRTKAILLTKEACLRNTELVESVRKSDILEKIAKYVEAIEEDNVKLAAKLETIVPQQKPAEVSEHMKKLASLGFTEDEIKAMEGISPEMLEKVAKSAEHADEFGLGRGVGPRVAVMDPFLEFLIK